MITIVTLQRLKMYKGVTPHHMCNLCLCLPMSGHLPCCYLHPHLIHTSTQHSSLYQTFLWYTATYCMSRTQHSSWTSNVFINAKNSQ